MLIAALLMGLVGEDAHNSLNDKDKLKQNKLSQSFSSK